MSEWIKNILSVPLSYCVNQTNAIAVQAITLIFNLYGKRLFKMDTDNIIKKSECVDNRDIFHLCPLLLKDSSQIFGSNKLTLVSGTVTDLVISVPWKAILTDTTHVTIDSIDLTFDIGKNTGPIMPLAEIQNSYLAADEKYINENENLFLLYGEINNLLIRYFNKVDFEIKTICINLLNCFTTTIANLTFSNNIVSIEKITFCHAINAKNNICTDVLGTLKNISIVSDNIIIDQIVLNSIFVTYLPTIYMDNSSYMDNSFSTNSTNLTINDLIFDDIQITKLAVNIGPDMIMVKKLHHMSINKILIAEPINDANTDSSDIMHFDVKTLNLKLWQKINLSLLDTTKFKLWMGKFQTIVASVKNKCIVVDDSVNDGVNDGVNVVVNDGVNNSVNNSVNDGVNNTINGTSNSLSIDNIQLIINYADSMIDFSVGNIRVDSKIILSDIYVQHNNICVTLKNIVIDNSDNIVLVQPLILSKVPGQEFTFESNMTQIKTGNSLDIYFTETNVTGITHLINFIITIIDKVRYNNSKINSVPIDLSSTLYSLDQHVQESSPFTVTLYIKNSNITDKEQNLDICIVKSEICITNRIVIDTVAYVVLRNVLISKIQSSYMSLNKVIIEQLQFFIDPKIFEQINCLISTLTADLQTGPCSVSESESESAHPVHKPNLKHIHEALSRSVIEYNSPDIIDEEDVEMTFGLAQHKLSTHKLSTHKSMVGTTTFSKFSDLTKSFHDLHSVLIDNYRNDQPDADDLDIVLNIAILKIHMFDKLEPCVIVQRVPKLDSQVQKSSFMCCVLKDVKFCKSTEKITDYNTNVSRYSAINQCENIIHVFEDIKYQKPDKQIKYMFSIKTGGFIDIGCCDPEWKYFIKFATNNMIDAEIIMSNNIVRINIGVQTFVVNMREETLVRFLGFVSATQNKSSKKASPIYIEYFNISAVNIFVNYYPKIVDVISPEPNLLTIKNYHMYLRSQTITYTKGIDKLTNIIFSQWRNDVNLDNILQFVPNVKILQPVSASVTNIAYVITKYFKNDKNKARIMAISQNINNSTEFITDMVKYGVVQICDFFNNF